MIRETTFTVCSALGKLFTTCFYIATCAIVSYNSLSLATRKKTQKTRSSRHIFCLSIKNFIKANLTNEDCGVHFFCGLLWFMWVHIHRVCQILGYKPAGHPGAIWIYKPFIKHPLGHRFSVPVSICDDQGSRVNDDMPGEDSNEMRDSGQYLDP